MRKVSEENRRINMLNAIREVSPQEAERLFRSGASHLALDSYIHRHNKALGYDDQVGGFKAAEEVAGGQAPQ